MSSWRQVLLPLFGVLAASCSATRHAERVDEVVAVASDVERVEALGTKSWCSDFDSEALDGMVLQAWADNVELKAAWARLKEARAVASIASSSWWPSIGLSAETQRSKRQFGGGIVAQDTSARTFWETSAAASYEVDVFGRIRHRANAADFEVEAAEASARALAITLTSQLAEAWFDVVAHQQRVELLEAQRKISDDILALTKQKLRLGILNALDVMQQEQNVESIRGQIAVANGLLATSRNRLAVLLGRAPSAAPPVQAQALPSVQPLPGAGVPANLLERRPDLRAALLRLEAADERTAAALADRLPQLRLDATLGFQANRLEDLFSSLFWSIGAGIFQPIFQGGRLLAEMERSEAAAEAQLYDYANTLLVAMREVRDAIALEQSSRARIESLERQQRIAKDVLDQTRQRYRGGTGDYLRVLTGLRDLQEVERTLLETNRQLISNRIALCRALGGSWVDSVAPSIAMDE